MKTSRNHLIIAVSGFFAALLGVLLFNIVQDPYCFFDMPVAKRPEYLKNHGYLTKVVKIIQKKPDTLVLGSSTVECGFALPGSLNLYVDEKFGEKIQQMQKILAPDALYFNGGANGGTLYEIYGYLQHAYLNNPKLKHVVIGLEWHLFTNERPPSGHAPAVSAMGQTYVPWKLYLEHMFTLTSTSDAYMTFAENHKVVRNINKIILKIFALINQISLQAPVAVTASVNTKKEINTPPNFVANPKKLVVGQNEYEMKSLLTSIYYISSLNHDFKKEGEKVLLDREAFVYLQKIVDYAKQHDIKVDFYISPQHGTHWATIERFGLQSYVDTWLKRVAAITPFWDFSGLIDFNPKVNNYFRGDDRHFNNQAGELILAAIVHHQVNPDKGVMYVTKKNVDQLIRYRRSAQTKWLAGNKYLAQIINNKKFPEYRHLHGDYFQVLVNYEPVYHHYRVFQFLGKYLALREQDAPYDLRRFLNGEYQQTVTSNNLQSLVAAIDAQGGD